MKQNIYRIDLISFNKKKMIETNLNLEIKKLKIERKKKKEKKEEINRNTNYILFYVYYIKI
jgi:hypothetical protein